MAEQQEMQAREGEMIALRLREELARRRISRQALVDMARISLSTLEKALSGSRPFTLATVVRIEDVLGTSLRLQRETVENVVGPVLAPAEMGAYSRQAVHWIERSYVTLRPSFGEAGAIYVYRTDIFWDSGAGHLRFTETDRLDGVFAQAGHVSMPNLSGHIYLMTSEAGQYRLIILGRATRDYRMFGLLSTLQAGAGSQLVPVSCPIAFVPQDQIEGVPFGLITENNPFHQSCRSILDTALADDFCRLRQ